jgi:hypothetical protein
MSPAELVRLADSAAQKMANIWGSLFRKKVDFRPKKTRFLQEKYLTYSGW